MSASTAVGDEPRRGLITISIMLATIMQAIDTTIANVALPHMQGTLSATQEQISWVLTSYIIAAAIMTPLTGFLAGRFGRKRLFLWSVGGFTVVSMLCGAATSLPELVVFRLLQGIFGAALVPLSQAVLLDTYPREQHGSAMAMWGVGVMVGPILGPTLGGYLTEFYNWRWVFYINLPFGVLALFGIMAFVKETELDRERPFDLFGFALLALALGAFQLMLDRGQSLDWFSSPEIIAEALIVCLFSYLLLVQMFTAERPFIEPGLFRDRNFAIGMLFIFIIGIILLATLALLPPFLQQLMGYPVLDTGYVLAPRGIGTMLSMIMVGRLSGKVDARVMIVVGLLLTALSLWDMTRFTTEVSTFRLVYSGILQGFGLGFIFVPMSTSTFATLAPKYRNEGTAMYSLIRNLGSGIGISWMMTLLSRNVQINHAALAENLTPFNSALESVQAWDATSTLGAVALNSEVTRQALTLAYLQDFRMMMWITLLALPLVFLLRGPRPAEAATP